MECAAAILLLGGVRWSPSPAAALWKRIPQAPAVLAGGCMLVGGVAAAFGLGGDPLPAAHGSGSVHAGSGQRLALCPVLCPILRSRVASAYQEELGCLSVGFSCSLPLDWVRSPQRRMSAGRVLRLCRSSCSLPLPRGPCCRSCAGSRRRAAWLLALGKDTAFLMGGLCRRRVCWLGPQANRFGRIPTALCYLAVTALVIGDALRLPALMQIALAEFLLALA